MAAQRTLQELEAEVYYIARVQFTDLNEEQKSLDTLFEMLDSGTNLMYNQRYREDDIDISSFQIYRARLAANNQEVIRAQWTGEQPQPWRSGNVSYTGPELKRHIEQRINPQIPVLRQRGRNLAAARALEGKITHPTGPNWYYGPQTTELPRLGPLSNIASFLSGISGKSPENQSFNLEEQTHIKSLNEFRENEEEYRMHPNQPNRGGRRTTIRRRKSNRRNRRRARSLRK